MAVRKIVTIDEEKCDACGLCVSACAEGAIQIVDGKARLVSDVYCDGLGACLGECPQGAITVEEREAVEFDEQKSLDHVAKIQAAVKPVSACSGHTCPGSMARSLETRQASPDARHRKSALTNWPVQMSLVPVNAPYFQDADILLAADCVPFAYADFHTKLLPGRALIIGCPKLDDAAHYVDKLADILRSNNVKSLKVARMEVPCCRGLMKIAESAVVISGKNIPFEEVVISIRGTRDE